MQFTDIFEITASLFTGGLAVRAWANLMSHRSARELAIVRAPIRQIIFSMKSNPEDWCFFHAHIKDGTSYASGIRNTKLEIILTCDSNGCPLQIYQPFLLQFTPKECNFVNAAWEVSRGELIANRMEQ